MKSVLATLFCIVSSCVFSQTAPAPADPGVEAMPDSASRSVPRAPIKAQFHTIQLRPTVPTLVIPDPNTKKSAPIVNRRFLLLAAFQWSASIADNEITLYGLSHGFRERNLIAGSHPSRAKLYALSMPINGLFTVWSYRLKKSSPHAVNWMVPPIVAGVGHSGASIYNGLQMISDRSTPSSQR